MNLSIDSENFMSSDLDESGITVLEILKSGANLLSDRKVDFSQKNLSIASKALFHPKTFISGSIDTTPANM